MWFGWLSWSISIQIILTFLVSLEWFQNHTKLYFNYFWTHSFFDLIDFKTKIFPKTPNKLFFLKTRVAVWEMKNIFFYWKIFSKSTFEQKKIIVIVKFGKHRNFSFCIKNCTFSESLLQIIQEHEDENFFKESTITKICMG